MFHEAVAFRCARFVRSKGFSQPRFYAWRRTLAERDAAAVPFVPVTVAPRRY